MVFDLEPIISGVMNTVCKDVALYRSGVLVGMCKGCLVGPVVMDGEAQYTIEETAEWYVFSEFSIATGDEIRERNNRWRVVARRIIADRLYALDTIRDESVRVRGAAG
ncbi:MAG: hypothetical protein QXP49_05550 [Nitrososphaerota archaeon]